MACAIFTSTASAALAPNEIQAQCGGVDVNLTCWVWDGENNQFQAYTYDGGWEASMEVAGDTAAVYAQDPQGVVPKLSRDLNAIEIHGDGGQEVDAILEQLYDGQDPAVTASCDAVCSYAEELAQEGDYVPGSDGVGTNAVGGTWEASNGGPGVGDASSMAERGAVYDTMETVGADVGLLPSWGTIASAIGYVGLGVGTFAVGYKIGGVIAGWLGLKTPGAADAATYGSAMKSYCGTTGASCEWDPRSAGSVAATCGGGAACQLVTPKNGFLLAGVQSIPQFCMDGSEGDPLGNSYFIPWGTGGCTGGAQAYVDFLPLSAAVIPGYAGSGAPNKTVTAPDPSTVSAGPATGNELDTSPAEYAPIIEVIKSAEDATTTSSSASTSTTSTTTSTSSTTTAPDTIEIPAPLPNELGTDYASRLRELGFTDVQVEALPDPFADPDVGPGVVTAVSPHAGSRVASDTEVVVSVNPSDAPQPGSGAGGDPGSGGSSTGIDFTPLTSFGGIACNSFPFGVPCWVGSAIGAWATSSQAPVWDWDLWCPPCSGGKAHVHIDLAVVDPAMQILRPILVIAATLLIAWMFFGASLGGRPAAAGGDE